MNKMLKQVCESGVFCDENAQAARLWMARWREEKTTIVDDYWLDLLLLELEEPLLTDEQCEWILTF